MSRLKSLAITQKTYLSYLKRSKGIKSITNVGKNLFQTLLEE